MRGNDRGKDFDDQFNQSDRRAAGRRAAGEGAWYYDKAFEREKVRRPRRHAAEADNCVVAAAILGGLAWAASEIVRWIA